MNIKDIIQTRSFNIGSVKGMRLLKRSIEHLGFCNAIVIDRNNKVLIGNKVLKHAVDKCAKIRVVETNGDELVVVKRNDIDYDTRKAKEIMLVDNLSSEADLVYDTAYIIETMNQTLGFDPRKWEGHSCLVSELSIEDCIKEGVATLDKKDVKKSSDAAEQLYQLSLFD